MIEVVKYLHVNYPIIALVENPSPDSYRLKSSFDFDPEASFSKSKAFTFGMSRQAYDKVYIPS